MPILTLKISKNMFDGELLGSWNVDIDGGTFRRLKVKSKVDGDNETETETESYLYLYNGELKFIVQLTDNSQESSASDSENAESDLTGLIDTGNTLIKINAFKSTDIDDKNFELPTDYKEVTQDEFTEKLYGNFDFSNIIGDLDEESDESAS